MLRRNLILLAATVPVMLCAPALAQNLTNDLAASSALEEIKKRGTIRVGFSTFVPWAMRNTKGEFIGFEIDVARKLAEDNEWQLELVPTAWDGIIPALIAGKFDVIIGGMSVTPKRAQTVNFTIPYAYTAITMAANKNLAAGMSTIEDFNKPDVTLAVRRGTSSAAWLQETFPNAEITYFDSDPLAFQEVLNGNAYGVVTSEPKPSLYTVANSDTLFLPFGDQKFNFLPGSFAVRKGDPDFLTFLNSWIQLHDSNGWLAAKSRYWFESDGWFGEIDENPFIIK